MLSDWFNMFNQYFLTGNSLTVPTGIPVIGDVTIVIQDINYVCGELNDRGIMNLQEWYSNGCCLPLEIGIMFNQVQLPAIIGIWEDCLLCLVGSNINILSNFNIDAEAFMLLIVDKIVEKIGEFSGLLFIPIEPLIGIISDLNNM